MKFFLRRGGKRGEVERERKAEEKLSSLPDPGCYLARMRCPELLNPLIWSSDGRAVKRKEPVSVMTLRSYSANQELLPRLLVRYDSGPNG